MQVSRGARFSLRAWTWLTLVFLYLPLAVIAILSFNTATSLSWPPKGLTTDWWSKAWSADGPQDALWNSVKLALVATLIALVIGTLAAFAMQRFSFYGKQAVSFMLVLPISLPGIVTAIALRNTFDREILGVRLGFGFRSLVVAHATFLVLPPSVCGRR